VDALERIAEAVLYEGYLLWPYRRSARKNQQRWTFGGVYPPAWVDAARNGDVARVQTQCLVVCPVEPRVDVELRFLHVVDRRVARLEPDFRLQYVDELITTTGERILAWDEAVERRIAASGTIAIPTGEAREDVAGGVVVRMWEGLQGCIDMSYEWLGDDTYRLSVSLSNTSTSLGTDRDAAQRRAFLSAHFVLRARSGTFVSATEATGCTNRGLWPVLVEDERTILASPIILCDFPQIAPESPTLLFDSGEIDQLLLLNTLSLTDAEKSEARATDPRARDP
jgi:hypothetical protein